MEMIIGILIFVAVYGGSLLFFVTDKPHRTTGSKPVVNTVVDMRKKPVSKPVARSVRGVLPEWFCVENVSISPAEQLIINELSKYRVKWYREIAFTSFPSSKYGWYRYDFILPGQKLIVEYDGKMWHDNPEKKEIDRKKDQFCKKHGIAVVRLNNKHYYKMPATIAQLMKSHSVPLA